MSVNVAFFQIEMCASSGSYIYINPITIYVFTISLDRNAYQLWLFSFALQIFLFSSRLLLGYQHTQTGQVSAYNQLLLLYRQDI